MTEAMKKTLLNGWHRENGARMVPFGGWDMPVNYAPGILAEHLATRKGAGLFDISHMGRFRVSGEGALPFLQHTLTNDASALTPGLAQYTIIPDDAGAAVDDAYLYQRGEGDYLLVVNASNTGKDYGVLSQHLERFPKAELKDITADLFMTSLQGPQSPAILEAMLPDPAKSAFRSLLEAKRNSFTSVKIEAQTLILSRTGYTGEPHSFELFTPAEFAVGLWERLISAGGPLGISPVGLGARDSLRLEAGYPLYGHEFGPGPDGRDIPIFAVPLSRFAVSFSEEKGDFVGREALQAQHRELEARRKGEMDGPPGSWTLPKRIFPFRVTGRGIARQGHEVSPSGGGAPAGHVTSGTMIPYWRFEGANPSEESGRRAIGLAYLRADLAAGQPLEIGDGRRTVEAVIVKRHLDAAKAPFARAEIP